MIAEKKHRGSADEMISIHEHLTELFARAIAKAFPGLSGDAACAVITLSAKLGDYQCNSAMSIANALKAAGQAKPARDIATAIVAGLKSSIVVAKVEVAGPGFINIFLDK